MQKVTSSIKTLNFETVFKITTFTFLILTGVAIVIEAITNGTPL